VKQSQTKKRKQVDRKASKGRKVRYNVHEKLVSFIPPTPPSRDAPFIVEQLFGNLFGEGVPKK
jgi:protein AATF/BFR2